MALYGNMATALLEAAAASDESEVRRLLDEGVDVNTTEHGEDNTTALMTAVRIGGENGTKCCHYQYSRTRSMFPPYGLRFHPVFTPRCRRAKQHAVVRLLLHRGADLTARDSQGMTPLHHAAEQAHDEVLGALLEAGAEVDARITNSSDNVYNGETALMAAARLGHLNCAQRLLNAGADLGLRNTSGNKTAREGVLRYKDGSVAFPEMLVILDDVERKRNQLSSLQLACRDVILKATPTAVLKDLPLPPALNRFIVGKPR